MTTKNIKILGLALALGCLGCKSNYQSGDYIYNFEVLEEQFVNPGREFKPAPLYTWNTDITRESIARTMTDMQEKGFGGVFIHPRAGLSTEYLSDEWFSLFRFTLDTGKGLDMNTWLYDENSYPSGFGGGHVPSQMPDSYQHGLGLELKKFAVLPEETSDYFLFLKEENGDCMDITDRLQDYQGIEGNYYLFSKTYRRRSAWHGGFSYVDLLFPGVTQKFIEVTMTGYKEIAGDEFGNFMPGWFTDEPTIQTTGGMRWTPDLFEVFQKKWGYDLKAKLHLLFEEKDNWKEVRHNYTKTLLYLFVERWAKPCFEFCEANNIKLTGHYWEHNWPNVDFGGDNMAMYAWQQMPGIDMLFNNFNEEATNAQFGNVRSVKEVRSVANQMGYRRTLCETYGAGGWEETFRDFKRLGDWTYALGVNFMNQHFTPLSILGVRKYDHPPFFSEHSPWWEHYGYLNNHFSRLSMALSAGEQMNDILILQPTTSVWLYFAYRNSNQHFREIGRAFQSFVTTLEKSQTEYDIGSENIIKDHGRVRNGKFVINKRAYSKVVLPPLTENLDTPTFKLLKDFAKKGGVILAFSTPTYLDGRPNSEIETFFTENKNVIHIDELNPEIIREHFGSPDIEFSNITGGNLYRHRRVMNDGHVLFLVNSCLDESTTGSVVITGKDAVELRTLTGEIVDYPETLVDNQKIRIDFDLLPAGSLLLYVFDKKQDRFEMPVKIEQFAPIQASSPIVVTTDKSNVLTIDFCDLQLGNELHSEKHVWDAGLMAFRGNGLDGNIWTGVQYRDNLVRLDTFSTGGFKAIYHFTVVGNFDMSEMQVAIERPELYKVFLNDIEIQSIPGQWFLDREIGVYNIGNAVRVGANKLVVDLSPMSIYAEIEPVYILGNFSLKSASKGWTIHPPANTLTVGSWKEQGFPFYPNSVSYTKTYDIETLGSNYQVRLGDWAGTVVEVLVNDQSAGVIGFEPYSIDVSELIRTGSNKIVVKVTGSNKNLLGPFHNNPAPGRVTPAHFRGVNIYPEGNQYQHLDYGLMEDFWLEDVKN